MGEALWVQASGVSYSAAEDRKLINAIFTDGVISGLVLSVGSGLNVNVSAGYAVIPDGSGGSYLAALDSSTPIAITSSTSNRSIYLTVNPTTGVCSLADGTAPANPYLVLGSASSGPSTVTSVTGTSSRSAAAFRASSGSGSEGITPYSVSSTYIGTDNLTVNTYLKATSGIILGNGSGALKRCSSTSTAPSGQALVAATPTSINYTQINRNVSDYGSFIRNGANPDRWYAPINGVYTLSAIVNLNTVITSGYSQLSFWVTTIGGAQRVFEFPVNGVSGDARGMHASHTMELIQGEYVRVRVTASPGNTVFSATASMVLVQAD